MTQENDIVLIHMENQPMAFARIEAIHPDHKPDWYHVKLLLLQIPLQVVTWILRTAYINGDTFTMDGRPIRLERVVCPEMEDAAAGDDPETEDRNDPNGNKPKVISLSDRKKK